MIRGDIKHPDVLAALAGAGHGAKILITDAHFPVSTAVRRGAPVVRLGFTTNQPTVPFIAGKVVAAIPVESAQLPAVPDELRPSEVQDQLATVLADVPISTVSRWELYDIGRSADLALCIVSGDTRRFGNVVLTVGVLAD